MKLEKFIKNKKSKGLVIGMSLGALVALSGVAIYKSYAIYKEEKNYNVIQGIIPDFGYDVKVAYKIDGQESENDTLPGRTNEDGEYYQVDVDCKNGEEPVTGTWDYNAWNLKIDNFESGTKCNLNFVSSLPKEDYEQYIENGVALRRSIYRGKDLSSYFANEDSKEEFYSQISSGEFGDIFVGDYIKTTVSDKEITWLIADIDNYLNSGCTGSNCPHINEGSDGKLTKHHVTIIPAKPLDTVAMYSDNNVTCGYAGSEMVKAVKYEGKQCVENSENVNANALEQWYNKYINCEGCTFKNHVLQYSNLLTYKTDANLINRFGGIVSGDLYNGGNGASSGWKWYSRKLDLMSEVNVYGTTIASSSVFDTGIDNQQYAIFRLKPELIESYNNEKIGIYWLKDVASSTYFSLVDENDNMYYNAYDAKYVGGIRPRFLVGGDQQQN